MRLAKKLLAGTALALSAAGASQAAIITNWGYSVSSLWTSAAPLPTVTVTPTVLSWGGNAGFGQSSLTIGNPAPSTVDTFIGGFAPPPPLPAVNFIGAGSTITHSNVPVFLPGLSNATLTTTLTLDANLPAPNNPGPGALPSISVDIKFVETPNSGTCSIPTSPTPCNDIFVQLTGLLNQSFSYDSDGAGGDAPVNYFVNIYPISGGVLSVLPATACAEAGVPAGCVGFSTPENQSTTLAFGFTISTLPIGIPEPGSIALIGIALAGLGLASRKRRITG